MKPKQEERLTKELVRRVKGSVQNDSIRAELFRLYMAEPYPGDQPQGKSAKGSAKTQSSFVSTAAGDLVGTIHTEVMDLMTSDGVLAQFAPVGPDDEAQAEQETDVVDHIIFQQNNGWEMLFNWSLSALIEQVGYARAGWEEKEEVRIDDYQGRTLDELAMMAMEYEQAGEEYQFVEQTENDDGTLDVSVRCVKKEKRYKVSTFPQSEFVLSKDWPSITLDGVPFCGWLRDDWTKADLRDFGFSQESIDGLTEASDDLGDDARQSTRYHEEEDNDDTEYFSCGEFYVRCALDDKSPASMWQVWASGDGKKIMRWKDGTLAVKEVDDHPFVALTPFPVPHRHAGRSAVELARDIQDIQTVLWRLTLDNTTGTSYARPVVDVSNHSQQVFDDLMNPAPGAPIMVTSMDGLRWDAPPNVTGATIPLIELMKAELEARTGVTRYNQGLDADSLNKTASGTKMIMSASQKRLLAVVRTFKETGIKSLYQKVHRDLRRGPGKQMTLRLRGKWVEVDPRAWRKREDVTVSGTNDKDIKAQGLQTMAMLQEKLLAMGHPDAPRMITAQELYATAEDMLAGFGYRSIARYMKDPSALPPPQPVPPPPDPMLMAAETDRMNAQVKAEIDAEGIEIKRQEVMLRMRELAIREAEIVGRMENDGEKLDLQRKKEAAADDRAREQMALNAVASANEAQQAAIAAQQPNPEIDDDAGQA